VTKKAAGEQKAVTCLMWVETAKLNWEQALALIPHSPSYIYKKHTTMTLVNKNNEKPTKKFKETHVCVLVLLDDETGGRKSSSGEI
jgi:hypothetical protein